VAGFVAAFHRAQLDGLAGRPHELLFTCRGDDVSATLDEARMGPIHWRVLALVSSGLFFDVMDFTIFGALVPDLIGSHFVTQAQVPWIGSITVAGLFVGTLGQGEFTDRFGRKAVYQFNLLLFGLATIIAALPPMPSIGFNPGYTWLLIFRFFAGVGLGYQRAAVRQGCGAYSRPAGRGRKQAGRSGEPCRTVRRAHRKRWLHVVPVCALNLDERDCQSNSLV
jgi:hypothetical protein